MKKITNLKGLITFTIFILVFEILIYILESIIQEKIKVIMGILILITIIIGLVLYKKKRLNANKITYIILIIGVLLRTMYVVYTPITERQHDVDYFNYDGHLSYIYTIYETNKLPTTNYGQYYHPPVFHVIGASWLKVNDIFNVPIEKSVEGIQILTLLFSSLTLFVISLILSRLKIKDKYKHLINLFLCVNPTFIILSGSINNDCLEYLFQFIILLYIMKYYENSTLKNSIILGITTGLCILTKLNGIIMLVPITIMFLYKLYEERKLKDTCINYFVLLFISLILGLSYQLRLLILFKTIAIPSPSEYLSIENYSLFERMIIPSFTSIFDKMYCQIPGDYNIFAYIVKCSIFGEFKYNIPNIMYYSFITINLFLIIISSILIIKNIKNIFKDKLLLLLISNYIINMISYLYFNYKYPFICTMDFRYIVPTLLTGIIALVLESNNTKNKMIKYIINTSIIIFIVLSFLFLFMI